MVLLAAGFAPVHPELAFDAPDFAAAREAIGLLLRCHMPNPALAVDKHWTLLMGNQAAHAFLAGCAEHLVTPPINVLRLSLHPEGLAPRILNLPEWRAYPRAALARGGDFRRWQAGRSAWGAGSLSRAATGGAHGPDDRGEQPRRAASAGWSGRALILHQHHDCLRHRRRCDALEVTIETFLPADEETARMMAAL